MFHNLMFLLLFIPIQGQGDVQGKGMPFRSGIVFVHRKGVVMYYTPGHFLKKVPLDVKYITTLIRWFNLLKTILWLNLLKTILWLNLLKTILWLNLLKTILWIKLMETILVLYCAFIWGIIA